MTPDEVQLKVRASYHFDKFLMYLIQDVTKKPSAEILNFFYELAGQIGQIGFRNMTGHSIDKKIDDYFPGTSIPFHMRVKGRKGWTHYDYNTKHHEQENETFSANVEVGFPDCSTYIEEKQLNDAATAIMEQHLLGGDALDLPPFEKPVQRSARMFKAVMDEFAGRPKPERKKRGKKAEDSNAEQ